MHRMLISFQACVILGAVTIFGILSWYFIPEDKWLRREVVLQSLQATNEVHHSAPSGSSSGVQYNPDHDSKVVDDRSE